MSRSYPLILGTLLVVSSLSVPSPADAAGLIWSLPADGTAATFRGTYTQLVRRTDATQQNVELSWTRLLTVRSVGQEQGEYRGQSYPCRWIEFEQTTGEVVGGQIQAGPGGRVLVKVLVPEPLVLDTVTDDQGIPVSYLPIAKGWKQIDDQDPVALTSDAFKGVPTLTLLGYPRELSSSGNGSSVIVGNDQLATSTWASKETFEDKTSRVTTEVELQRSPDAPFGVAGWSVSVANEKKGATADRAEFESAGEVREELVLAEIRDGAVSLLNP